LKSGNYSDKQVDIPMGTFHRYLSSYELDGSGIKRLHKSSVWIPVQAVENRFHLCATPLILPYPPYRRAKNKKAGCFAAVNAAKHPAFLSFLLVVSGIIFFKRCVYHKIR
jgi:hypothetical protein